MADAPCDTAEGEERPPSRPFWRHLEGGRGQERGAGRSPTLQKAWAWRVGGRLSLNESCWRVPVDRWFVRSGRVGSSDLVRVQLLLAEGQSVQSRDPASGTERLPSPPRPHRDSGENPVQFPQSPVRAVGRPLRAGARHEPSGPRRRDSELRSPRAGRRAQGSRDFLFFWVFV